MHFIRNRASIRQTRSHELINLIITFLNLNYQSGASVLNFTQELTVTEIPNSAPKACLHMTTPQKLQQLFALLWGG